MATPTIAPTTAPAIAPLDIVPVSDGLEVGDGDATGRIDAATTTTDVVSTIEAKEDAGRPVATVSASRAADEMLATAVAGRLASVVATVAAEAVSGVVRTVNSSDAAKLPPPLCSIRTRRREEDLSS